MRKHIAALFASLVALPAGAVDDGRGRDWRPLAETAARPTWEQVAAQCPTDGATPCSGTLGSIKLKDWVWASRSQVLDLFGLYAPGILASPTMSVGGYELQAAAAQFQAAFGITAHLQGCPTYQPCWNVKYTTGMTSTADTSVVPAVPWGGQVYVDLEWGGGGFSLFTPLHPDLGRGLWLWRPTGLGTLAVHAYDDDATLAQPGGAVAIANVLANDWVGGQRATLANATLTQLTSAPGLTLNAGDGSVRVADGTPAGSHSLDYRLCNRASPAECDNATVTVLLKSFALVARPDSGAVSMATGGTAIANVLANDSIGGFVASPATVQLSTVSSGHPGVTLNAATGAVQVAAGTPHGSYLLNYRICERANPANCAQTTASVVPYSIDAVNDSARGSSKYANTPLASVLTNDRFNGQPASIGKVSIALVSIVPANNKIRLDTADGSVDVLGKTSSGTYQLTYRLCERASPANCDQAVVTLDLSGRD
jgi:hypothetical protein